MEYRLNPTSATVTIIDNDVEPVVIGFRPDTYNVDENAGGVTLTVEVISGVLTQDVTLTYTTADGSATSSDYTGANGAPIPTLSALITSVSFRIAIVDDGDVDPAETFMVSLGGAPVGVSLNPTSATVTIIDNDVEPVVIGFSSDTYNVDEDAGGVTLTVEVISGVLTQDVTLTYTTADGSATSSDYTGANGAPIPTLSALITSVSFRIAIVDDGDVDPAETFMVNLGGAPVGVSLNPTSATVTIIDNDVEPVVIGFSSDTYNVDEDAGGVTLTVEVISGVLTQDVTLIYTTADGSATSSDYTGANGAPIPTLSALITSVSFRIAIVDDGDVDPAETFMVSLGGAPVGVSLNPTSATVTIIDNDVEPVVIGFRPDEYDVDEDAGGVTLTVEVISGVLTQDVTLTYTTADGSATSSDYTGANGAPIPTLSALITSVTFRIAIVDDGDVDPAETFMVNLGGAPVGVSFNPTSATVTIIDNDVEPVVIGFRSDDYDVDEDAGGVTLTVEVISGVLTQDVTLTYTTADGSATSSDYTGANGVPIPTLSALITSVTFRIAIVDDGDVDPAETFMVSLGGAPVGVSLNPTSATVTIIDNDVVIGFSSDTYNVDENSGEVELTVNVIDGVLTEDVEVTYTTTDDGAIAPDDYTGGSFRLTLPAMARSVTFTIPIIDDSDVELAERFTIALSNAPVGVSFNPTSATVRIIDNDVVIGFRPDTYEVDESAGGVTLTVEVLSGVLTQDVTLTYTTADGTATSSDYTGANGVPIPTLSALITSVTFRVSIIDDLVPELTETFRVDLNSVMSLPAGVTLDPRRATVTITDTDTVSVVIGFDPDTYVVGEASGTVELTVKVLEGSLTRDVTLTYETMAGTATSPADYTHRTGEITLSSSDTSGTIVVSITDDNVPELDEMFTVVLSGAPEGVLLDPSRATVTIIDNDVEPVVIGFKPDMYEVDEDAGGVTLTVEVISGVLTEDVTLTYTTADGTATSSEDYTGANGVPIPTLSALITSVTFRIAIVDDGDVDPAETFMVNLGGAPAGVSFNPTGATV